MSESELWIVAILIDRSKLNTVVNVLVPLRGVQYIFTDSQMSYIIMLDSHTVDSQAVRDLFNFLQDLVWVRSHEGFMFRITALRK